MAKYSSDINPAITLARSVVGIRRQGLLLPYVGFQVLGGSLAGLTLRVASRPFDSTQVGSTQLAAGISPLVGIILEALGTLSLSFVVLLAASRIKDDKWQGLLVGIVLFALILLLGPLTGASFNPARSLGPSLASGYFENQYAYWIGPLSGGIAGAFLFRTIQHWLGRMEEKSILFVCVENAGRSQMAEAFARKHGITASSAGTRPAKEVNPVVVKSMHEKGIDLSSKRPRILTPEMIEKATLVVTMGCSVEEVCPRPMIAQMQKKIVDWHLKDPKGRPLEQVRKIRDEIESKVASLRRDYTTQT